MGSEIPHKCKAQSEWPRAGQLTRALVNARWMFMTSSVSGFHCTYGVLGSLIFIVESRDASLLYKFASFQLTPARCGSPVAEAAAAGAPSASVAGAFVDG